MKHILNLRGQTTPHPLEGPNNSSEEGVSKNSKIRGGKVLINTLDLSRPEMNNSYTTLPRSLCAFAYLSPKRKAATMLVPIVFQFLCLVTLITSVPLEPRTGPGRGKVVIGYKNVLEVRILKAVPSLFICLKCDRIYQPFLFFIYSLSRVEQRRIMMRKRWSGIPLVGSKLARECI